ncbi:MAG: hypothetical protein EZS28_033769, partial [Streblomastix strix]
MISVFLQGKRSLKLRKKVIVLKQVRRTRNEKIGKEFVEQ